MSPPCHTHWGGLWQLDYCTFLFCYLIIYWLQVKSLYLWFGLFNQTFALIFSNPSWPHLPCPSIHHCIPSWESLSQSCCLHAVSHPTFLIFPYHPAATDTPCRSIKRACTHTNTHPPSHSHTNTNKCTQTKTRWQIVPTKNIVCSPTHIHTAAHSINSHAQNLLALCQILRP